MKEYKVIEVIGEPKRKQLGTMNVWQLEVKIEFANNKPLKHRLFFTKPELAATIHVGYVVRMDEYETMNSFDFENIAI